MAGLMEYDPNMERPEAPLLSRLGPFNFAEKYNADMQRYGQNQMYGLIDQYSQPRAGVLLMTPDNLAVSDSNYGRHERQFTPNADFYMRASTIPGFAGLATGMQSQQGAMDRQVQEQGWSVNPVSNQAQQNEREKRRLEDQQAQQRIANENAKRQLDISGGHLQLARDQFNQGKDNNLKDVQALMGTNKTPATWQGAKALLDYREEQNKNALVQQGIQQGLLDPMTGKPLTQAQTQAKATLATMLPALDVINQGKGDMGALEAQLGKLPFVGDTLAGYSRNSAEGKQRAAEQLFAANYIHAMSGTAAGEKEVSRLTESIFNRPGDTEDAKLQKFNNREAIKNGINILAGGRATATSNPDAPSLLPKGWKKE